ncbi:MAG: amidohydrolase [Rhodospirillales bacterium]|nr:amidohydrolase [Acetobacter sp.]
MDLSNLLPGSDHPTNAIINVHTHFIPDTYRQALDKAGVSQKDIGFALPPWSVESRLADMDEYGVQTDVLSLSSPGLRFWQGQEAVDLGRKLNEELAEIIRVHPTRFGGYTTLPLPDVDAALEEIAYGFDVLGLDGVVLMSNYEGTYLGDTKFAPVMEELNRRQAVVFVHPTETPVNNRINLGFPAPMIEYPFDSTRTVVSLLDGETLSRCPDIRFIISHGGGTLPFLGPRIGIGFSWKQDANQTLSVLKVKSGIASLYFDLAISTYPAALLAIQNSHDASKLLMGFDLPFLPPDSIPKAKKGVADFDKFSKSELAQINSGNALKLFPRLAEAIRSK